MNKKQAGIIVTLLLLIAVAGVLATKLNTPLYGLDGTPYVEDEFADATDTAETSISITEGSFDEASLKRESMETQTLLTLEELMNEENISEDQKKELGQKYFDYVMKVEKQVDVETQLKAQGYDALCFIDENVVKVYVKSKEDLTEDQYAQIRALVSSETEIKEIEIGQKK